MSNRREPSSPPLIPGFEPVRLLGMGGFADVFVYRQQMPAREVAVKVLNAQSINEGVRERFRNEANVMAQLSQHPAIVTIHHADVALDGRPFLVMELCSRPGLGARYRSEEIPLSEALRLGVRLASAVESAHRMGILHYDIKPANVLTTDFGWPALTDFGIAATIGQVGNSEIGLSIPWSPPELLSAEPVAGDPRSDIYSLIATIYSAVAGRSPFELRQGPNGPADLMSRIEGSPLPATGRAGVPMNLELIFERGLAKDPQDRFQTPLEVAQELQCIESQLALPMTHIEMATGNETISRAIPEADQETRVRPILSVDAAGPQPSAGQSGDPPGPPPSATPVPPGESAEQAGAKRRRAPLIVGIASLVVLALVTGITWAALSSGSSAQGDLDALDNSAPPAGKTAVPTPTDLKGRVSPTDENQVIFTWDNPDPRGGDQYLWAVVEAGEVPEQSLIDEPEVTVALPPSGEVCIEVAIVREDRRASDVSATECAP